jgi:DNA (cytosine-5)-methyltransferase 1
MGAKSKPSLKAVDFFCGPGGMSYGLSQAGISVLAGIDNDADCRETYVGNVPGGSFIKHDLCTLSAPELGRRLRLRQDDPTLVFAGCSPCQFWSKIRTDRSKSIRTAFLLAQFQRFIRHFLPGFLVIENVPGLLTRESKSILPGFVRFLEKLDYVLEDGIINAVNYGVPQNRKRYLLVGSRVSESVTLPPEEPNATLTVRSFLGPSNGFEKIAAGYRDESDFQHTASAMSAENLERIRLTPKSGGNRFVWKDNDMLQIPAYRGRDDIFRDVYARMYWDRPAPSDPPKS